MTCIAVVATSARLLAEAARADGFEPFALDVFGDADTRRASAGWSPIGAAGGLRIDAALLLAGLADAQRAGAIGWVPGSGFDGRADLLEAGAEVLPLIGNAADAVRRVRDPARFFGALDAAGIAHPEVRFDTPTDATGWLVKDLHGCGGWHIRPAAALASPRGAPISASHYFQRVAAGVPMSATFLADRHGARVLGCNELRVRRVGDRPYIYCGVVGPVVLAPRVAQCVSEALRAVVSAFGLRGLGSLDFMRDGATVSVLELNPRPPASLALYADRRWGAARHGIFAAHLRACTGGLAPEGSGAPERRHDPEGRDAAEPPREALVHGTEIVFAARPLALDAAAVRRLAQQPRCHDLPAAALRLHAGDPVCSVSAQGRDAAGVRALLDHRRTAVHDLLETAS